MAPEVLMGKAYTETADIYSLGIVSSIYTQYTLNIHSMDIYISVCLSLYKVNFMNNF